MTDLPAYALDATYRVMAKTTGGSPQKLPRAREAAFHPGSLSRLHCLNSLERWLCLCGVWMPTILEIQTGSMDLYEVSAPYQSFGWHTLPGYKAAINFVVSDDLVVCRPQKRCQCAFTHAKFWHRQLSNLLEAFREVTLLPGIAHASRIKWRC